MFRFDEDGDREVIIEIDPDTRADMRRRMEEAMQQMRHALEAARQEAGTAEQTRRAMQLQRGEMERVREAMQMRAGEMERAREAMLRHREALERALQAAGVPVAAA